MIHKRVLKCESTFAVDDNTTLYAIYKQDCSILMNVVYVLYICVVLSVKVNLLGFIAKTLVELTTYNLHKCKNHEIRCRDDTVPKTVDTRSHCKVWLRACNNLPQPQKTEM